MILFGLIFTSVFFLDWVTKFFVRSKLALGSEIPLTSFFSLTHVENTGVAFGFFQGYNHIFLFSGFLIAGFMFWFAYKTYQEDRITTYFLGMVLGGAMGNLLDRVMYGRVTDFLHFFVGSWSWPDFNVADAAICTGSILILIRHFFHIPKNNSSRDA
ncbi:MAG: signal peptidase II [Elusimicrobiota bacterium]